MVPLLVLQSVLNNQPAHKIIQTGNLPERVIAGYSISHHPPGSVADPMMKTWVQPAKSACRSAAPIATAVFSASAKPAAARNQSESPPYLRSGVAGPIRESPRALP